VSFDGSEWIIYNDTNSALPYNYIPCLATDINGTKWMGAWVEDQGSEYHGLIGFNENGIPVGVKDYGIQTENVIIYPNPASNNISLDIQPRVEIIFLEIINIQGKVILHQKVSNNNISFNVSSFPDGLYVIRLNTNKGIEIEKLIIQ